MIRIDFKIGSRLSFTFSLKSRRTPGRELLLVAKKEVAGLNQPGDTADQEDALAEITDFDSLAKKLTEYRRKYFEALDEIGQTSELAILENCIDNIYGYGEYRRDFHSRTVDLLDEMLADRHGFFSKYPPMQSILETIHKELMVPLRHFSRFGLTVTTRRDPS
jgi:hypothetical protein